MPNARKSLRGASRIPQWHRMVGKTSSMPTANVQCTTLRKGATLNTLLIRLSHPIYATLPDTPQHPTRDFHHRLSIGTSSLASLCVSIAFPITVCIIA